VEGRYRLKGLNPVSLAKKSRRSFMMGAAKVIFTGEWIISARAVRNWSIPMLSASAQAAEEQQAASL
jgi:hypothetical protein